MPEPTVSTPTFASGAPDPHEADRARPGARTPRLRWMIAVFALGLVLLHQAIRLVPLPPSLADTIARVHATPGDDVVILGTCLASQELSEKRMEAAWGGGAVDGLGMAGTGPMDWALAVKNELPAGIEHVVVAFVAGDLQNGVPPWESRTPELMRATDVPAVWESCDSRLRPGSGSAAENAIRCRVDVTLLYALPAYRYRGFVAAEVWNWLGAQTLGGEKTIGGRAKAGSLDDLRLTAPTPAEALRWLERLADAARARGVTLTFLQMPVRADASVGFIAADPNFPALPADLKSRGATYHALPTINADLFEDEHHVRPEGSDALSDAVGAWLKQTWPR